VLEVARVLADLKAPWYVAGGWAIDLYLNESRRNHKDVDVAVFRRDQLVIQSYLLDRGWELYKYVGDSVAVGRMWVGEQLGLPDRGILARPPAEAERIDAFLPAVDLLLSETDGVRWWYHADLRITHALETVGLRSKIGVPILSPEIVLLFKARHVYESDSESLLHRQADDGDFNAVERWLPAESRSWLNRALELLYPGHAWLDRLRQNVEA
jgi:hypothetical protein